MTTFMIPESDDKPYPTLGPQLWEWMLENLIYGPGDLRGVSLRDHPPDAEFKALLYRMYEVYPKAHPNAGRRRFKRVCLSLRKGTAKTEKAAWIAAAELHPDAPVRTDGWSKGKPIGVGVRDPYIPMVAYTEEQTEDLAYAALYVVISEGPLADDFDIGLERIMRTNGDGKAVALASAPDSRDGARTTFQHFDETHRFTLPRLVEAHQTMQANLPKRKLADAWSLETTTAYTPGENSVAEKTMDYARLVDTGKMKDPRLFFFHRQASDSHDLKSEEGVRAAVIEASGPAAEWSDIDSIVALWADPSTDRAYWERVWTNRMVQAARQAFDRELWDSLGKTFSPDKRDLITLGFDGSRFHDSTALIATHVETGWQWKLGIWERPDNADEEWEIDRSHVTQVIEEAFDTFTVWRLYGDPPDWQDEMNTWAGRFGEKHIVEWWTNRYKLMAYALKAYQNAMRTKSLSHSGDETFSSHIGNARRKDLNMFDDSGARLWNIEKERPDSPFKIDAAMAGCLSWEARGDALAAGATKKGSGTFYAFS